MRGRGGESQASPRAGGEEMPLFLGRKSRCAFGQPAFLLEGNRMTTKAFEKEGFFFKA